MILAVLVSGVIALQTLPSHSVRPLRNANVVRDAIARSLDDRRVEQGFRGVLPPTRVVRAQYATSSDLTRLGFRLVRPGGTFMLVQLQTFDAARRLQLDSYAYDPQTHLVRYEMHQRFSRSYNALNTGGPNCPH